MPTPMLDYRCIKCDTIFHFSDNFCSHCGTKRGIGMQSEFEQFCERNNIKLLQEQRRAAYQLLGGQHTIFGGGKCAGKKFLLETLLKFRDEINGIDKQ